MPLGYALLGLRELFQRADVSDLNPQITEADGVDDSAECVSVGMGGNQSATALGHGEVDSGGEAPALAEQLGAERALVATDHVEHRVNTLRCKDAYLLCQAVVVANRLGTQRTQVISIVGQRGANDSDTITARHLEGERSHSTGSGVDQDGLAGVDTEHLMQRLIGCQTRVRHCRGGDEVQRCGFADEAEAVTISANAPRLRPSPSK